MSDFLYTERDGRLPVFGTIQLALKTFAQAPFLLIGLALLPLLPALVIKIAARMAPTDMRALFGGLQFVVQVCVQCVSMATSVLVVRNLSEGGRPEATAALQAGLKRAAALARLSILQTVVMIIAFLLLIVPGFVAAFALLLTVPVCVLEGVGARESLKRSARLTKGNRLRLFGIVGLVLLAVLAVLVAVGALMLTKSKVLIVVGVLALVIVLLAFAAAMSTMPTIAYLQLRRLRETP